jgi:hypothetical protein
MIIVINNYKDAYYMPSNGSFWFGDYGFLYKKNGGAGGRKNLALNLICNQPTYLYNKYKPGINGIGATTIATRRARNRKATLCIDNNCGKLFNYLGNFANNPNGFYPFPVPNIPRTIQFYIPLSTENISGWQGIRYNYKNNTYLFSGTNTSKLGVLYTGTVKCNIATNYTTFAYPGTTITGTSAYGPNILYNTDTINVVGCYNDSSKFPTNLNLGFIYTGSITDFSNPLNYKSICVNTSYCQFTYVHSVMGNFAVLCTTDASGYAESYLYNLTTYTFTQIQVPTSLTTTAYGIWTIDNINYTIVGGYSATKKYKLSEIFNTSSSTNNPIIYPIGVGYIITYNAITNTFSNFTQVVYPSNTLYLTHIEGISEIYNEPGMYSIVTTTENDSGELIASFTKILGTSSGYSISNDWININYPTNLFNTGNSCANYIVCGMTAKNILSNPFPYQASIFPY